MQQIESLLNKFWSGEASEEEKQQLLILLTEQEAELTEQDKVAFFRLKDAGTTILEPERSGRLLNRIHDRINTEATATPAPARVISLRRAIWWAAAAILVLGSLGVITFMLRPSQPPSVAYTGKSIPAVKQVLRTVTATMDTSKVLTLQDGSVVTIGKGSAISYYEPFNERSRDISLTGVATFKVAKNPAKPFNVYSNGIITTAVGTAFTVNTEVPDIISVHLLEGKVVIRPSDSSHRFGLKEVYLEPGQQFTINKITSTYLVKNLAPGNNEAAAPVTNSTAKQPATASVRLSFNNEPLQSVFSRLTKTYKINIRFNDKDISGLYFSGTVLKGDSLKMVLSTICSMNELKFTEKQGYFLVQKSN